MLLIKHFYESRYPCSARVVDWIELNKIVCLSDEIKLYYLGNYLDDDDCQPYALFAFTPNVYCLKIK